MHTETFGSLGWKPGAWFTLAMAAVSLAFCAPASAQGNLDVQAMVHDTQRVSRSGDQLTLVWWLPEQYWRASMDANKSVSRLQEEKFLSIIRPYNIIAVVDGQVGAMAGVSYLSEDALRKEVSIKDEQGHVYAPLADDQIGPDAKNLLMVLKPIIANLLGALGNNMYFLVFPAQNGNGQFFANPTKNGMLTVDVGAKVFQFRLPLGSFLPPMYDAATGERFPGNYRYSPFSGKALNATPPSKVGSNSQ
ncbi:hypothetical protein, partial [Acidithiobacillus sp.]|uniref:hypothetical protein n=1 Tax=Acidithiobacillus sp. TaxID=1872118 RepID=UPI00260DC995